MEREIFSTEIGLETSGSCSQCKKEAWPVVRLRDRTQGTVKLCNECLGFYHIHVNAEPYMREAKADAAQERLDRVEKEEAVLRRMERTGRRAILPLDPETVANDSAHLTRMCDKSPMFAAAMGLLMLERAREVAYEKTVMQGDNVVTERLECRDGDYEAR